MIHVIKIENVYKTVTGRETRTINPMMIASFTPMGNVTCVVWVKEFVCDSFFKSAEPNGFSLPFSLAVASIINFHKFSL